MSTPFSRFAQHSSGDFDPASLAATQSQPPVATTDSESVVIGSLLANNALWADCRLTKEHFQSSICAAAYAAMKLLADSAGGKLMCDASLVASKASIDRDYLHLLATKSATDASAFLGHTSEVKNASALRDLAKICAQAAEASILPHASGRELALDITAALARITADSASRPLLRNIFDKSSVTIFCNQIDRIMRGLPPEDDDIQMLRTGVQAIDDLGGLSIGSVHGFGAGPGVGKTALSDCIARNVVFSGGHALFWGQELPERQARIRSLAAQAGISQNLFVRRDPNADGASSALQKAMDLEDIANDRYSLISARRKPSDLRGDLLVYAAEKGQMPNVAVLDYAQITDFAGLKTDRYQSIGGLFLELSSLAKEFNICIICLSQITPPTTDRDLFLEDFRESRDIGMHIHSAVMMRRYLPEVQQVYQREYESNGQLVKLTFPKNRNARPDHFRHVDYDGEYMRFETLPDNFQPPSLKPETKTFTPRF